MYSRYFRSKEFSSHEELTTFFEKKAECDVISVAEFKEKWIAFYYERVMYYEAPSREIPDKEAPWFMDAQFDDCA